MVHDDRKDSLKDHKKANPERSHRTPQASSKEQEDGRCWYTPQITVRAIQKGFERGTENVFHRLHHGSRDTAVFQDPDFTEAEHEVIKHTTGRLMKSRRPLGVSAESWRKVKEAQSIACNDTVTKYERGEAERNLQMSPSPDSTIFTTVDMAGGSETSPRSNQDMFSPRPRQESPNAPLYSARSNATASTSAQPPMSTRTASSSATRATTPGTSDPIMLLAGKAKGQLSGDKQRFQPSPSSSAFQAPSSREDFSPMDGGFSPDEGNWPPMQVVEGTHKVIAMLEHCEEIVDMKSVPLALTEYD